MGDAGESGRIPARPSAFCKTCRRDVPINRAGAFITHGPYRDQFFCPASGADAPAPKPQEAT